MFIKPRPNDISDALVVSYGNIDFILRYVQLKLHCNLSHSEISEIMDDLPADRYTPEAMQLDCKYPPNYPYISEKSKYICSKILNFFLIQSKQHQVWYATSIENIIQQICTPNKWLDTFVPGGAEAVYNNVPSLEITQPHTTQVIESLVHFKVLEETKNHSIALSDATKASLISLDNNMAWKYRYESYMNDVDKLNNNTKNSWEEETIHPIRYITYSSSDQNSYLNQKLKPVCSKKTFINNINYYQDNNNYESEYLIYYDSSKGN